MNAPDFGDLAAGDIFGGIFSNTYQGGTGLKNGSVFGKLAGQSAAEHVVGNA